MYFKRTPCLDKVCSGGKRLLEDCLEKGNGFIKTYQWFFSFVNQVVPITDTHFCPYFLPETLFFHNSGSQTMLTIKGK